MWVSRNDPSGSAPEGMGLATLLTEPGGSSSLPPKLQATISYNVPSVFRNSCPLNEAPGSHVECCFAS